MRSLLVASLICAVAACAPDIKVDEGEGVAPIVEFDPANSIIPFPNNLLLDPMTGKVNLPEQCNESVTQTALREFVLNQLNGFGTFKTAILVTLSEDVDMASLEGRVKMFKRADAGTPIDPAEATEVPLVLVPTQSARSSADCSETSLVPALAIVPAIPLDENGTYTVVMTEGITSAAGETFAPSTTWALVRLEENPVTVENGVIVAEKTPLDPVTDEAQLLGIDLLYKAHAAALDFLDFVIEDQRNQILLAWDFNTQTTTVPLDATIADTPANTVPTDPFSSAVSLPDLMTGGDAEAFMIGALPGFCQNDPNQAGPLPCQAVGDVIQADIDSTNYQTETSNPVGDPIKGQWTDPIAPDMVRTESITVLSFVPATLPPNGGYPTVIFGHGLTRSRDDLFAIASQLAGAGIASVAINWVAHGDRAVQISNAAAEGCSGTLDPTVDIQCFDPIISSNLGATRDNLRQSVLDALTLVEALKACENGGAGGECGALEVNPDRIGYIGQSLGSIIGSVVVAMGADIKTAVLNVGAVGLVDIVENTATLGIKCPLVDALIDAGVIVGDKFDPTAMTGICTGDEWKAQPGWQSFAGIGRWILDPADGANYVRKWGTRPILIQRVIDDTVVPNVATATMGQLDGLTPIPADMTINGTSPTADLVANVNSPLWVDYENLPADANSGFPGNTYAHGSLLQPQGAGPDAALGTGLMQTDAITYLVSNL